jgi:hypothetical protein
MSDIQEFIQFWQINETAPKYTNDSARLLWEAHKRAVAQLHEAENETIKFLRPTKVKGGYTPGFHPGTEDDVAGIAARIEEAERQISTIEAEIEEFMSLTNSPSLLPLQKEVDREKSIVSEAIVASRKTRQIEERRIRAQKVGRLAVEAEISSNPAVIAAVEHEAVVVGEHGPKADALRERSVRANGICARHDHRTAI